MFDRPVNWRGILKVYAIKEALSEDDVKFSRRKTQSSKAFLVGKLANPEKDFQWKSQKRHLRRGRGLEVARLV